MKTSTLDRTGVSPQMVDLIARLVDLIPWPLRRSAMGDVTLSILEGRPRVAENVFGWNRGSVQLGMHESRSGIRCVNDLSRRRKPKAEEKNPRLLGDIVEIMDPQSQAEGHLRTTLLYTNMTAKVVYEALLQKGWSAEELPNRRTISNILNRHDYRLRRVVKTQVEKKRRIPTPSSRTCGESMPRPM
jgi:hypothetical protein